MTERNPDLLRQLRRQAVAAQRANSTLIEMIDAALSPRLVEPNSLPR